MQQNIKLHSSIFHPTLRKWQENNADILPHNLMYPLFIVENDDDSQEIASMPNVKRIGINILKSYLQESVKNGLSSVLLFGVIDKLPKDNMGTSADSKQNPVIRAIPKLREWFPELIIACDVCLCPYTDHGHCGVFIDERIDNAASIKRLAEISLAYAKAGAHVIAPSDMMDNRVAAIREILLENKFEKRVAILSYAVKFASCFYGPFRDAAQSAPKFGDRKCYQLPPGSKGLSARAAARDVEEGADMLMVKPGMPYLDIVRQTKDHFPRLPLFVYQVSGEYAMIFHGSKNGAFDLSTCVMETMTAFRRAGADCIISYFTPLILEKISRK